MRKTCPAIGRAIPGPLDPPILVSAQVPENPHYAPKTIIATDIMEFDGDPALERGEGDHYSLGVIQQLDAINYDENGAAVDNFIL